MLIKTKQLLKRPSYVGVMRPADNGARERLKRIPFGPTSVEKSQGKISIALFRWQVFKLEHLNLML